MIRPRPVVPVLLLVTLLLTACQVGSPLMAAQVPTPTASRKPRPIPPPWRTAAPGPTPTPTPVPLSLLETENILLLGTDRRPNWTSWRTDTIMVVGIDRERDRVGILSIPRDLYVEIPGIGPRRINQADYYGERVLKVQGGGPALLSQVISDTLGIPIRHWVRVEIQGFRNLIDALGGVTVHLDCPFYEYIYDRDTQEWTIFELPAGEVTLDGDTAYLFVTLRLRSNDFSRAQRQRQLLWALREKVSTENLLPRIPELWQALWGTFATDLSLLQVLSLAQWGIRLPPERIHAAGLDDTYLERFIAPSGADVLRIQDPEGAQALIQDMAREGRLLAATGRQDTATCPARPTSIPQVLSQLVGPSPSETPTPVPPEEP